MEPVFINLLIIPHTDICLSLKTTYFEANCFFGLLICIFTIKMPHTSSCSSSSCVLCQWRMYWSRCSWQLYKLTRYKRRINIYM